MKNSIIPDSGLLTLPMTNDYLFRALLQQNNKVLKGLISSLLHLSLEEIISVEITNPIELGAAIDAKAFFLDIKALLNNDTSINLEMQVINEHNWVERSLSYLCRAFDGLSKGVSYIETKSAIQIGFLDFTLFPGHPEFHSRYQLLNVKNYIKYSDKLSLHVVDLTHIDLATEEDRHCQMDYWAAFFKATTWEEINMLAEKNEFIAEAAETVYKLSQDEMIRLQCEAREDYYRRQGDAEILKRRYWQQIDEMKKEIREGRREIREGQREIREGKQRIQEGEQRIQEKEYKMQAREKQMQEIIEENKRLKAENEKLRSKQF